MISLTASYSDHLDRLLQAGQATVDGLEFGPWASLERTRKYLSRLSDWKCYFHPGNMTGEIGWKPGALRRLQGYLALTRGPWASFHLTPEPLFFYWLAVKKGIYLPRLSPEWLTRAFIRKIQWLAEQLPVPILLENQESWPDPRWRYNFKVEPERIRQVIAATGAWLLLDLGHARIAAEELDMPVKDYLNCLPLEKVQQVHVSGPRARDGRLYDLHQPLQEVDYVLLEWTLAHTHPQVVTLEYIQELEPLREQLQRLRSIIDSL
jgi:hypothetical protein